MYRVYFESETAQVGAEKWTSVSSCQRAAVHAHHAAASAGHRGRGLHSSTFRLNVNTFCGVQWVHDPPPVC